MNLASCITGFVVLVIVFLLIRNMIKEKRSGKCSCGCSSCSEACPHCLTPIKKRGDEK